MNIFRKSSKNFLIFIAIWSLLVGHLAAAADIRIGLVLDKGGKDDKSFNSAAYKGAMQFKSESKSFVKVVEATDDNAFEPAIRGFAKNKFDLIISIGVSQVDALKKVAADYPQGHFAIVDGEVNAPNVRSLLFEEHEGSFIVGAIAAQTSKTGTVGFIGGVDIPLIRRFKVGFEAGAKHINPKIKVISNYVGLTADSWNNPAGEKVLAISQYDQGADVIFSAAGASGMGLFDAAEEKKKLAIGVDSNQNWVKPGFVLTSMVKRVDQAVFTACKDAAQGKFTAGTQRFGLANQGVDYTFDNDNNKLLLPLVKKRADELKIEIISGKIQVPDYYKTRK